MNNILRTGVALAMLMVASPMLAVADNAVMTQSVTANGGIDAGSLISKDVVDAQGNPVGQIDSVMVDAGGNVQSVIVDVGGWLQADKLIPVAWKDLKQSEDGKIVTSLTKDIAAAAPPYDYADETLRGKVMTAAGKPYAPSESTGLLPSSKPIKNADGSINTSKLLGLNVENGDGDVVGEVGEVVLDEGGSVQGVVVDVGGFLGVGVHPVLLNWKDVQLSGSQSEVKALVNATKARLKALPAYEGNLK